MGLPARVPSSQRWVSFLTPSLSYTANSVVLTLTQTITFPSVAGTPNQVASGTDGGDDLEKIITRVRHGMSLLAVHDQPSKE